VADGRSGPNGHQLLEAAQQKSALPLSQEIMLKFGIDFQCFSIHKLGGERRGLKLFLRRTAPLPAPQPTPLWDKSLSARICGPGRLAALSCIIVAACLLVAIEICV
jgi:hypothetical protein